MRRENKLCGLFVHVGCENVDAGGDEASEDRGSLFGRFAASVDDFGKTRAQAPMMIDARVTEIFKRQRGKTLCGGVRCQFAAFDLREKFKDGGARHALFAAARSAAC